LTGAVGAQGTQGTTQGDVGAQGTQGFVGQNGTTVLNGAVDPTTQGIDGDFYINVTSKEIFGPKVGGVWGAGSSIVGRGAKVIVIGISNEQNLNNSAADSLDFNDALDGIKDAEFSHSVVTNPSRITVNQTGRYKIELILGMQSNQSNSRLTIGVRVRVNGTVLRKERRGGYVRVNGNLLWSEFSFLDYLELNSGDYIEFRKRKLSQVTGITNRVYPDGTILIVSFEGM
jgi:hypothetical protein